MTALVTIGAIKVWMYLPAYEKSTGGTNGHRHTYPLKLVRLDSKEKGTCVEKTFQWILTPVLLLNLRGDVME